MYGKSKEKPKKAKIKLDKEGLVTLDQIERENLRKLHEITESPYIGFVHEY